MDRTVEVASKNKKHMSIKGKDLRADVTSPIGFYNNETTNFAISVSIKPSGAKMGTVSRASISGHQHACGLRP